MKYETLPGLRLPVSKGVLGTMNFGDTVDELLAGQILDASLAAGVTMLDTANAYSGGACEEMVGRLMRGHEDHLLLATKVGIPHRDADGLPPLSPRAITNCMDGSLRRLGVEKVDLYYLHAPDRETPVRETVESMKSLYEQGKFGAWAFSNYSAWQSLELIQSADQVGLPRPVLGQQLYNTVSRKLESEYIEFSMLYGLHLMVYNPLVGGLLSGKHHFDSLPSEGRFGDSKLAEMYKKRYWSEALFSAIHALQTVADNLEISLPELAFRWLLSKKSVGSILLGASKFEQIEANLKACSAEPLDEESLLACDAIGATLSGPMANYNR
jgi:aryl-alcohol dehydrogenase-like predicted oxidoreductase